MKETVKSINDYFLFTKCFWDFVLNDSIILLFYRAGNRRVGSFLKVQTHDRLLVV